MPVKKPKRRAAHNPECPCGSGARATRTIRGEGRVCAPCYQDFEREVADAADVPLSTLLTEYTLDPRRMPDAHRHVLAGIASKSRVRGIDRLERISRDVPDWRVGDEVDLFLASFSSVHFSESKSAGQITWKTDDGAIIAIDHPTRGLTVDYSIVNQRYFNPSGERETIVSGVYRVAKVERIVEPFTFAPYGYKVPMFTLAEAG